MTNVPSIEAIIVQADGEYYPVRLAALPSVGDSIDFYPLVVDSPGDALRRKYEVTKIEHKIYATIDQHPEGHHSVTVYVR